MSRLHITADAPSARDANSAARRVEFTLRSNLEASRREMAPLCSMHLAPRSRPPAAKSRALADGPPALAGCGRGDSCPADARRGRADRRSDFGAGAQYRHGIAGELSHPLDRIARRPPP